jgi:hypothetical protein
MLSLLRYRQPDGDMDRFVKARLYADGSGKMYSDQQELENKRFGAVALPLYGLLNSNGDTILARNLFGATPAEAVRFSSSRIC